MIGAAATLVGAAAVLVGLPAWAQTPEAQSLHPPPAQMERGNELSGPAAQGVVLVRAGRLIDPAAGRVGPASLLIQGGRIAAVGRAGRGRADRGAGDRPVA